MDEIQLIGGQIYPLSSTQDVDEIRMSQTLSELLRIVDELTELATRGEEPEVRESLQKMWQAAREVGKAWSGSWLGYHANVYTSDFLPPHSKGLFDPVEGLKCLEFNLYTTWREYTPHEVEEIIYEHAGIPDMKQMLAFNDMASSEFHTHKFALLSILDLELCNATSPLLFEMKTKVDDLALTTDSELVRSWAPEKIGSRSRDRLALFQGKRTPPHISVGAKVVAIEHTLSSIITLEELTRNIASHLSRQQSHRQSAQTTGERVFIGHGRSHIWRELKDFLEDDLGLLVDEFNRIPTAGGSITNRLSVMLDSAAIAFLVMTGEDEQPDGALRARENVVHEAGLFQGRLGFERAIVLLQVGCEKFSNNAGLVHINFPKDKIRASFQDIRDVLEREGILNAGASS